MLICFINFNGCGFKVFKVNLRKFRLMFKGNSKKSLMIKLFKEQTIWILVVALKTA
jgi:hypothetical protein